MRTKAWDSEGRVRMLTPRLRSLETARAALCRERFSRLHIGQGIGWVLPRDLAFFELVGGMIAAKTPATYYSPCMEGFAVPVSTDSSLPPMYSCIFTNHLTLQQQVQMDAWQIQALYSKHMLAGANVRHCIRVVRWAG